MNQHDLDKAGHNRFTWFSGKFHGCTSGHVLSRQQQGPKSLPVLHEMAVDNILAGMLQVAVGHWLVHDGAVFVLRLAVDGRRVHQVAVRTENVHVHVTQDVHVHAVCCLTLDLTANTDVSVKRYMTF